MNHPFIVLCYFLHVCVCVWYPDQYCLWGKKNPQWVLGCWMGFTPTSHGMAKTKIPVYAKDGTLVIHPGQYLYCYPGSGRTKINYHQLPSLNVYNTQFHNVHRSIVTIFTQYIPQNKDYMLQERRDELAMYACYTLR